MAEFIGTEQITAMSVGATAVTAMYFGSEMVYSGSSGSSGVEYVGFIYEADSEGFTLEHRLDTGIAHTASTMTIEIEYFGISNWDTYSDRIVGYAPDDPGCLGDDNDFRVFACMMGAFDYLDERDEESFFQNNKRIGAGYQRLVIGDGYCYDKIAERNAYELNVKGEVPSPGCHIYVDVSYNKVRRVIIRDGNTVLFDGRAAKDGSTIGLYDSVSQRMITNTAVTMTYDEGYEIVKSIETDGACWFDTNILPDETQFGTVTEMYLQVLDNNIANCGFIGTANSTNDNSTYQITRNGSSNYFKAKVGNGEDNSFEYSLSTTEGLLLFSIWALYYTEDDGYAELSSADVLPCNYSLYIGGVHNPDYANSNYMGCKAKFNNVKIWKDDGSGMPLWVDFVPAVNGNKVGFWDIISGDFIENLGTGTAVAHNW